MDEENRITIDLIKADQNSITSLLLVTQGFCSVDQRRTASFMAEISTQVHICM